MDFVRAEEIVSGNFINPLPSKCIHNINLLGEEKIQSYILIKILNSKSKLNSLQINY